MSSLVVIGNGFDIAQGIATRYSDFMQYLTTFEKLPKFIHDTYYLLDSVSEKDQAKRNFYDALCKYIPEEELWSSFEEALNMLDIEEIKENNSEYLVGYGDDNWSDSCNHDYQYQIKEELRFADLLPMYFSDWICGLKTLTEPIVSPMIINNNSLFINFNYTDTLEKTYNICSENILYIHGKALKGDRLIIGHNDNSYFAIKEEPLFSSQEEADIYYDEVASDDPRVQEAEQLTKSYFKNTYKNVDKIISSNQVFFSSLNTVHEIYVLGHSLSDIDLKYFEKIKHNVMPRCLWHISYYSGCDYNNVIHQLNKIGVLNYKLIRINEISIKTV